MSALVQVRGDAVMASSADVARSFEKRHSHVLRSIAMLVKAHADLQPNFGRMVKQVEIGSGSKRDSHYYEMDRKGFTLLAMGFTGPKALEWKIAYIDAFDRMEAALRSAVNDDEMDDDILPPARPASDAALPFVERLKFEPPNIQIAFVREMRMARGRPGAIMAMRELGWEQADAGDPAQLMAASDPVTRIVLDWVRQRTDLAPGHRIRTMVLYHDFVRWCAASAIEVLTVKSMSMALERLGYPSRRSDVTYKMGLKLKD
jgi:Rha family phage regulatory protein